MNQTTEQIYAQRYAAFSNHLNAMGYQFLISIPEPLFDEGCWREGSAEWLAYCARRDHLRGSCQHPFATRRHPNLDGHTVYAFKSAADAALFKLTYG